ncbi:MAG: hypothetical protein ABEL76_02190 [Bradymonadaceae bacterium]
MAAETTGGRGAGGSDEEEDRVTLADAVDAISRREWPRLRLEQRSLLFAVFRAFARGKRAIHDSLGGIAGGAFDAAGGAGIEDEGLSLEEAKRTQKRHADFFKILVRRVETGDVREASSMASPNFEFLFERALPRSLGAMDEHPTIESKAVAVAIYQTAILGVLADTGYAGILTFFDRNGFGRAARAPFERFRRQDRHQADVGARLLERFVERSPGSWQAVAGALDRTFLPTTGILRDFQSNFDFVDVGLLPDEFVGHAIERFCAFYEQLHVIEPDPRDSSPGNAREIPT